MKDIVKEMLKVLNINNTSIILTIVLVFISCKSIKEKQLTQSYYTLNKFKSKKQLSSINIKAYDYEYKNELNASAFINNVFSNLKPNKKKEIIPTSFKVKPNSRFNIEIFLLSRYPVNIKNLVVEKGDSIVINAFLKQDSRSIH